MKAMLLLAATFVRLYLRDRTAVALSLALMVFMMVLFGTVMGDDQFKVTLPVAVLDNAHDQASSKIVAAIGKDELLSVIPVQTESDLLEQIRRAHVIAGLVLSPVIPGHETNVRAMRLIVSDGQLTRWQRIGLSRLDQVVAGTGDKPEREQFEVEKKPIQVVKNRYIDFIFPGMLAMAIMQACLGSGVILLQANKDGVLRQLRLTPISTTELFCGFILGRLFIVALHLLALGLVAVFGFGAQILAPWSALLFVLVLGCVTFMAIGMALAVVAPSFETGNLLVQLVSFPMSFLCGVFIKMDQMPKVLEWLASALPLTYLAEMIRGMMNLGLPLKSYFPDLAVLTAWLLAAILVTALSMRRLRDA